MYEGRTVWLGLAHVLHSVFVMTYVCGARQLPGDEHVVDQR